MNGGIYLNGGTINILLVDLENANGQPVLRGDRHRNMCLPQFDIIVLKKRR